MTTPLIAKEAGCSVGSLYQYFGDKRGIIDALTARHYAELWTIFDAGFQRAASMQIVNGLHEMVRTVVNATAANPRLHELLETDVARTGVARREFGLQRDKVIQRMATYLEAHRSQLDVADVELAAFVVVHSADALILRETSGLLSREQVIAEVTKLVARYLGAK
jgi:AcrR family transcriptional regulator